MIRSEPRARDIVVYLLRDRLLSEQDAEKLLDRVEHEAGLSHGECPTCDDEWAAHVTGLHKEPVA